MKRMLKLLFVALLSFSSPVTMLANEHIVETVEEHEAVPYYAYIAMIASNVSISTSGLTDSSAQVITSSSNHKVTARVSLEKYANGSWSAVKSWTQTRYDGTAFVSESYYVTKGYNYRTSVVVDVYSSSGELLESQRAVSNVVYY